MSIAANAARHLATAVTAAVRGCAAALLPQNCLLCAAPGGDNLLCAACQAALPRLSAERCPLCALPAPGSNICGGCLGKAPHFDATQAVFSYEFPVDSLIHALKYAHRLAAAEFLGRALAQLPAPLHPDLIVPVPWRRRGWRKEASTRPSKSPGRWHSPSASRWRSATFTAAATRLLKPACL